MDAMNSVLTQTIPTTCLIVCDGAEHYDYVANTIRDVPDNKRNLQICVLPENVGANGFYGHRIYAAFSHLVNTEFVGYLDEDNWLQPNHIESCLNTIEKNSYSWCNALRNLYSEDDFICPDDCENLGKWPSFQNYHLIDTNCYLLKTSVAIRFASVWHGGWGQDRVFMSAIVNKEPNFGGTGEYTVNYRISGEDKKNFFLEGNKVMSEKYNGDFPWKKKI
jgi:glycosyltransferase involved in cell wall biosynthesis